MIIKNILSHLRILKQRLLRHLEIVLNLNTKHTHMKTNFLLAALTFTMLTVKAQNENKCTIPVNGAQGNITQTKTDIATKNQSQNLYPVYFNFRKRVLADCYKNRISPVEFLYLCRSIQDSAVQAQVNRYDGYSKDKANLGIACLGSGAATFALFGSAASMADQSGSNTNAIAPLIFFGVLTLISVPVMAGYTSVPHQKRKEVLFRDLPIAYNQYVESLNK